MTILSIQSAVAWGHVGNSAAVFALQRLGHEVVAVDTVQFSNHPGHPVWAGRSHDPAHVAEVLEGLDAGGVLAGCRAALSGYLGQAASGEAMLAAVARVKAADRSAPYLCDPVMGDDGRLYVGPGIPELLAGPAVASADIVTPNRFELELLAGRSVATMADAVAAARRVLARGPKLVVATSLPGADGIVCAAITAEGAWAVETPRLDFPEAVNGAGDLLAALLLDRVLRGAEPPRALAEAVSSTWAVLEATLAAGRRELALVAAQDQLAAPSRRFEAAAVM
ncbi:pyridoxal kinase PdxY [Magnetospirillum sp. UT-4]|uniref:pyridoxal kinase PdxY n=1 Tax=Magnetospirillum sp. UT-4 TaxID=2681467 RepID=UPI00137F7574|nr:pyridoxal kinase PdxY [Magnetospirillum sp. UT-4]CAA7623821.1 Pyridoxamine kinase [Magnetospirillum sp. UT-4]